MHARPTRDLLHQADIPSQIDRRAIDDRIDPFVLGPLQLIGGGGNKLRASTEEFRPRLPDAGGTRRDVFVGERESELRDIDGSEHGLHRRAAWRGRTAAALSPLENPGRRLEHRCDTEPGGDASNCVTPADSIDHEGTLLIQNARFKMQTRSGDTNTAWWLEHAVATRPQGEIRCRFEF
jgi:hypothetical protein